MALLKKRHEISFLSLFFSLCVTMGSNSKILEFKSAVRGYHYYRKFWEPTEEEELRCAHEPNNPYDSSAIRTCSANGFTVGHLPFEIARPTNFLLLRGARVEAKLS